MKVYIVAVELNGDEGALIVDRAYEDEGTAQKRGNAILSAKDEFWARRSADIEWSVSAEAQEQWLVEKDMVAIGEDLHIVAAVQIEGREIVPAEKQYIEYCSFCYKVDCHKPNYGAPEPHSRTAADIRDVDVIDGRVRRKTATE